MATVGSVRVIGGANRGRQLAARLPGGVRPTSDRVREAVFDILDALGGVEGAHVLDLFCGSGAMGLEALSRGAASATFVDRDTRALAAVERNLRHVGLEEAQADVVRATLPAWLARGGTGQAVDVVFCDPPYAFDRWEELLGAAPGRLAILESDREVPVPEGWDVVRTRRYGGTLVTVARHPLTPAPREAS